MPYFLFLISNLLLATAGLPPEAAKIVEQLPERALTVPMVVGRAAEVSESFKEVTAQAALTPVSELAVEGLFAPKLSATAGHYDDQLEVAIPAASAIEKSGVQYKLGLEKYFSTGTAAGVSIEHTYNKLEFSNLSAFPPRPPYYQTTTSLNLSQNLLKDSFGISSRSQLRAASIASKAQASKAEQTLEQWTMGILVQVYEAWLSQRTAEVAELRLENRKKLLKATKLKVQKGTSETPDRLQVESVNLNAESLRDEAEQALNDKWRTLVISLKFPKEWMLANPRFIPIKLDDPIKSAQALCESFKQSGVPNENSADVRLNKYLAESADEMLRAKKNLNLPQLALVGELKFNGIENQASDSISEGTTNEHPYWTLGLSLNWPLGLDAEKSESIKAYSDRLRAEALFQSSKDDLQIMWENSCASLRRLTKSHALSKDIVKNLQTRERLEEKRFQIGRISVFNFIQAGDDANDAELAFSRLEITHRMAAWQILKLGNAIPTTLQKWRSQTSASLLK